jgi:hypothetical protein
MSSGPTERDNLRRYISAKFCDVVKLPEEQVLGANLTLREIVGVAPGMTNSVDLMEAFAKTANALRKDRGLKVRLPTVPLDSQVAEVLEIFLAEAERELTKASPAASSAAPDRAARSDV